MKIYINLRKINYIGYEYNVSPLKIDDYSSKITKLNILRSELKEYSKDIVIDLEISNKYSEDIRRQKLRYDLEHLALGLYGEYLEKNNIDSIIIEKFKEGKKLDCAESDIKIINAGLNKIDEGYENEKEIIESELQKRMFNMFNIKKYNAQEKDMVHLVIKRFLKLVTDHNILMSNLVILNIFLLNMSLTIGVKEAKELYKKELDDFLMKDMLDII